MGTFVGWLSESLKERFPINGNTLNQDLELGQPIMTENGILNDNEPECRALLNYMEMEIDSLLENLDDVDGVKFPQQNRRSAEYKNLFDQTALEFYEAVVGRAYPKC